jgi:hypothetical protein
MLSKRLPWRLPHTPSPLRVSQGRRLKFVGHLFFGEFFGREATDTLNRDGIILERQPERPSAVFVLVYSTSAETVSLLMFIVAMLSRSVAGVDGSALGSVGSGNIARTVGAGVERVALRDMIRA